MSPQSIPAFAMACIVLVIGVQNISVFFHRPHSRVRLTFFLACMAIALYELACAYLYSATTTADGQLGQRFQLIATAILAGIVPWFIVDYFRESHSVFRTLWTFVTVMSVLYLAAAAATAINPFGLFWTPTTPFPKTIDLPFGIRVVYNEASLGVFAGVQDLCTLVFIAVLALSLARAYARTRHAGMLPVLGVMAVMLACAACDLLVATGRIRFVYTLEYAIMAWPSSSPRPSRAAPSRRRACRPR